jgi:hypothetical protein
MYEHVHHRGVCAFLPVQVIPNNADAGANSVKVTRSGPDAAGGYVWTVTFRGLHGNVDQMAPLPSLAGSGATVAVTTLVEGNQLAGTRCILVARSDLSSPELEAHDALRSWHAMMSVQ